MLSWPDIKLSLRLLIRNPGLTVVSTVGIAVGIAIAAGMFGFFHANFDPTLPLDEGDRIVALENWDVASNNENRQSLHDFVTWRDQMTSVVEISAFRTIGATMQAGDRVPETVRIAAMSASGFRVARVPALLGRFLTPDDEREAAPPVVVIGYDVWRSRFEQDRSVLGQQVRFGNTQSTIVGVMPEGFAFPVNHQYWIPLRANPSAIRARCRSGAVRVRTAGAGRDDGVGAGGAVGHRTARGRGISADERDAEAAGAGLHQTDHRHPGHGRRHVGDGATHDQPRADRRRPQRRHPALRPNGNSTRRDRGADRARRESRPDRDPALRRSAGPRAAACACWASRSDSTRLEIGNRIMALDLDLVGGAAPFWLEHGLQPSTMLYVLVLVVVTAAIAGILPALHATRRRGGADLRQLGGSTGHTTGPDVERAHRRADSVCGGRPAGGHQDGYQGNPQQPHATELSGRGVRRGRRRDGERIESLRQSAAGVEAASAG